MEENPQGEQDETSSATSTTPTEGLDDLQRKIKEAYDFSVKVVQNANGLFEHSRDGSLKKLREWSGKVEALILHDEKRLNTYDEYCKNLQKHIDTIGHYLLEAESDREYVLLKQTLSTLQNTRVEEWMRPEDTDYPVATLIDFVDLVEIEKLHGTLKGKAYEIGDVQNHVKDLKTRLECRKVSIFNETKALFHVTSDGDTFVRARQAMQTWIETVEEIVNKQQIAVKVLSSGSLGLASLYDHLLHHQDVSNLEGFKHRIVEFLDSDFSQLPQSLDHHNTGATTTDVPSEKLSTQVQATTNQFKKGLKLVADMVDAIKETAKPFIVAKQSYRQRVTDPITEAINLTEGHDIEKKVEVCRELKDECSGSEFSRLNNFYKQFLEAQSKAEEEVRRRWKALGEIEKLAREQEAQLRVLVETEMESRKVFCERFAKYLPQGFLPALSSAAPTSFQYVIVNGEDANALHDCMQKLSPANDNSSGKRDEDVKGDHLSSSPV